MRIYHYVLYCCQIFHPLSHLSPHLSCFTLSYTSSGVSWFDTRRRCQCETRENFMHWSKMVSPSPNPTDWLTHWFTDSLTDWLTDWLTDSLPDWLTDWLTHWLTHCLTHCLTDSLTDWLTHWLADNARARSDLWQAQIMLTSRAILILNH